MTTENQSNRTDGGMTGQKIAVIPGDGIGSEVISSARAVLDAVCTRHGIDFDYSEFDWSCERYERHGAMMPADGIDTCAASTRSSSARSAGPPVPDPSRCTAC